MVVDRFISKNNHTTLFFSLNFRKQLGLYLRQGLVWKIFGNYRKKVIIFYAKVHLFSSKGLDEGIEISSAKRLPDVDSFVGRVHGLGEKVGLQLGAGEHRCRGRHGGGPCRRTRTKTHMTLTQSNQRGTADCVGELTGKWDAGVGCATNSS